MKRHMIICLFLSMLVVREKGGNFYFLNEVVISILKKKVLGNTIH